MDSHILETVNRLRLIQVDFANESEQTRTTYLCEEIEKALKCVLPDERNEFLEKLLEKFPVSSVITQTIYKETQVDNPPKFDESALKDVDFLVRNLLEIAPKLSDDQKDFVNKSLQKAGLRPQDQQDNSLELGQKLKQKLKLQDEFSIDANQITELNIILVDFVLKLESLVWKVWLQMSPKSVVRPQGDLTLKVRQFLSHDTSISPNQINHDLKLLLRLIMAITSAVGRVGGQFAKLHLAKFSPSVIEELVQMEPSKNIIDSLFADPKTKCWLKYMELAETLNEDFIEMEIRKAVVNHVEALMKGIDQ